ncbi:lysophospholipid acyltransferase family protein [Neobacillus drentensis]|uniref:lysophospholipid acyltransferase family protein n=1 Tax=Neobacillus drentensis TaxID=220684 RepID=UPI0030009565
MIPAKKSKWFSHLFHSYQRYYLWLRNFHSVQMAGEVDPRTDYPVLYIANHCSWWDGLIIFQIIKDFSNKEHFIMMEERQLRQYPFFRKLGAFSIDKEKISEVRKSLLYAQNLMANKRAVWIFPQGAIYHQEKRPFVFQKGSAFLLKRFDKCLVKPVSLHYSFNQYQRPTASIFFGEEVLIKSSHFTSSELTQYLEELLEQQVTSHRDMVINDIDFTKNNYFTPIQEKGKSTSDFIDNVKKGYTKWKSFSS